MNGPPPWTPEQVPTRGSYSIASSPTEEELEFCIKMIGGQLTSILNRAQVGDTYLVEGPMGHFIYEGQKRCGFVAGGTGIAPFISMLRFIRDKGVEGKFILFYSARRRDIILYKKELEDLAGSESVDVVITLTREEPEGWTGEKGRINEAMLRKHGGELKGYHWFLCGPLKMTIVLREALLAGGVDEDKLKFEGWG